MMVFWVDSASHAVTSIDAYSTGHATPSPDTTLGGTSDLTGVSGSLVRCGLAGGGGWVVCGWCPVVLTVVGGWRCCCCGLVGWGVQTSTSISIVFSRLLVTGDTYDQAIGNSALFLLWAYNTVPGTSPTVYSTGRGGVGAGAGGRGRRWWWWFFSGGWRAVGRAIDSGVCGVVGGWRRWWAWVVLQTSTRSTGART